MKLLIVSPHCDDAAFSIPLAMREWELTGHELLLVSLFTWSAYAPRSPLSRLSEPARQFSVSALRKQEDERFLAMFASACSIDLALMDAPLRLGCAIDDLCDRPVHLQDPALRSIQSALEAQLHARDGALVLPLALGGHVDHATAHEAALPLAANMPCAFYEDVPYAMRERAPADLARMRAHVRMPLRPVLYGAAHPEPIAWRMQAAVRYPSQISTEEAREIAGFCKRYNGAERLWVNDAWLRAARNEQLSRSSPA